MMKALLQEYQRSPTDLKNSITHIVNQAYKPLTNELAHPKKDEDVIIHTRYGKEAEQWILVYFLVCNILKRHPSVWKVGHLLSLVKSTINWLIDMCNSIMLRAGVKVLCFTSCSSAFSTHSILLVELLRNGIMDLHV